VTPMPACVQVLLNQYVRPLLRHQKELGVNLDQLKRVFSNIEAIANFHQILCMDLQVEEAAQVGVCLLHSLLLSLCLL